MTLDRFIHFKERRPSHEEAERIIKHYIGEAGSIEWVIDRWMVTLQGLVSHPFEGMGVPEIPKEARTERWLEIYFQPNKPMDIMTRMQDEFTNAVADQLAKAFGRFYKAELQME